MILKKYSVSILLFLFCAFLTTAQDAYLDERAQQICDRIAQSQTPIENLGVKGAFMLRVTQGKGLTQINKDVKHQKLMEEKYGVTDANYHDYSNYFDNYIAQKCIEYNKMVRAYDRTYKDKNTLERYFTARDFVRDYQMANQIDELKIYFEMYAFAQSKTVLENYGSQVKQGRWTNFMRIFPGQAENSMIIHLVDRKDHESIIAMELKFAAGNVKSVQKVVMQNYSQQNPYSEVVEEMYEVIPGQ
jgi:hypothetical protein